MARVGRDRMCTSYMIVYLMIPLPKSSCIYTPHLYMVLANPTSALADLAAFTNCKRVGMPANNKSALHTSHVTLHTSHVTLHTSHVTLYTSHVTLHTLHTSHVLFTHHTCSPHITRDSPHNTRNSLHITPDSPHSPHITRALHTSHVLSTHHT
jgi:hypothetical protein